MDLHSCPPPPPTRHLAPLFDNPKLDKELRAMLREKFPEFCSSPSPPVEGMEPSLPSPVRDAQGSQPSRVSPQCGSPPL